MGRWVKTSSASVIRFYEQSTAPTLAEGITLADLWVDTLGIPVLKCCSSLSPVTFITVGGGGGTAAPSDATYYVASSTGTLSNEIVFSPGNYAESIPTIVTSASTTLVNNKTYVINSSSLCSLTLPATSNFGDFIYIRNIGAGGFKLVQGSSQKIHFGILDSTLGSSGYIQSTQQYDSIDLLCTTNSQEYMVSSAVGNLTVV